MVATLGSDDGSPLATYKSQGDALFVSLQNFVNPLGLGDAKSMSPKWEAPLAVETYTGDILRTAFFLVFHPAVVPALAVILVRVQRHLR